MSEITLLNGERWNLKRLVKEMEKDDFYYGYCGKNMLSSSAIKLIEQSMKKFFWIDRTANNNNQALRDGWLFHTSILEPHKFAELIFCNTLTKGVEYKKMVKEYGDGNVFTQDEKQKAERLMDAFYKNHKAVSYLNDAQFEVPICGEMQNIPFRAKADVFRDNQIVDLKTTRNIKYFKRDAYDNGYDIQCYLYSNLFNIDYENFKFVAIDKNSLDIGIYHSTEQFYKSGENKVKKAIDIYKTHIEKKEEDEIKDFIYNYYIEENL